MARSFVVFRGDDLEFNEVDLMVYADYVQREISAIANAPAWLNQLHDRLGGAPYCFVAVLDEYLIDDNRIGVFLDMNQRVVRALEREDETIPVARLEKTGISGVVWTPNYATHYILELAQKIAELIVRGQKTKAGQPWKKRK